MNKLKFSVAMCVYGGDNSEWVDDALNSVISQNLKPAEVVLIVDGPIPVSIQAVIDKYTVNDFLKPFYLKENKGHGEARRLSLEKCSYDYVALMDSDDICSVDRFEKQIAFLEAHPEVNMLGGAVSIFFDDPKSPVGVSSKPETHFEIAALLRKRCPLANVTVILKKQSVLDAGGYIDWFCEEDYYLWARMIKNGCITANLPDVLVAVRTTPEQMGRRGGVKYFKSEVKMQKYMLQEKMISKKEYVRNVLLRFVAEMLLPPKMRYNIRRWFIWKKQ